MPEPRDDRGSGDDAPERSRREPHGRAGESDGRFQLIFEHTNDAIFVLDAERDAILHVNSRACRMLGYSYEELVALPVSALHRDELPELLAFTRSVFDRESGWTDELSCTTRSGDRLPAEISASLVEWDGRTCVLASVRDVSARKRLEAELQRYTQGLERVVEERTALLARSETRHRLLLAINNALVSHLEREPLFHAIAEALRGVVPFDMAALWLHDPADDVFRMHALETPSMPRPPLRTGATLDRRDETHVGRAFETRRPLVRRDLEREREFPVEDRLLASGIRSYVALPLLARGSVLGTLNLVSRTSGVYSEEDGDFLLEVALQVALAFQNVLAFEEIARLKARVEEERRYLQEEIRTERDFGRMVGRSAALRAVMRAAESVGPTEATVLVTGETGTGKELVARAVHELSPRRERTLVKVNCAAMAPGLIESELFGHERGAFTGAVSRRVGRFELADGGTLFLDEIGDLPLELQAKLLRVLQEGEFERVGGSRTIPVSVRVIAASNRDLEGGVAAGRFREDLYYRLNVFPIHVPPLRERKEDIPLLARYFVARHAAGAGRRIDEIAPEAMSALVEYPWPGNVRELENVMERAVVLARGPRLEPGEWMPTARRSAAPAADPDPPSGRTPSLNELQRDHILDVLNVTGWRVRGPEGAARRLGLKPTTLEARMKKLGIRRPSPHASPRSA
jgi:formate hydrogenlyase transcriptional activator